MGRRAFYCTRLKSVLAYPGRVRVFGYSFGGKRGINCLLVMDPWESDGGFPFSFPFLGLCSEIELNVQPLQRNAQALKLSFSQAVFSFI